MEKKIKVEQIPKPSQKDANKAKKEAEKATIEKAIREEEVKLLQVGLSKAAES